MSVADYKPITVTIADARKLSGLGSTKLFELIKERKIDTVAVGRRRLVVLASLERLLTPTASAG